MARRRILLVDDDPRLLHVLALFLGIEGYEVETAVDGEEGCRAVAERRPDLVLLDVMMPGTDGLTACRRIKEDPATRDIPVILFTALSRDEDVARGLAAGADQFINKPFSLSGLAEMIRGRLGDQALTTAV